MGGGFRFHPDGHWIEIDLAADPEVWGRATARQKWHESGRASDWFHEQLLVDAYTELARAARRWPPVFAYVLSPEPGEMPAGVVRILVGDVPSGFDRAAMIEEVCSSPDVAVEPAQVDEVETRAGTAVRVRERYHADDALRTVYEDTTYAWLVPEEHALLVASITFVDLTKAVKAAPLVESLARSCEFFNDDVTHRS